MGRSTAGFGINNDEKVETFDQNLHLHFTIASVKCSKTSEPFNRLRIRKYKVLRSTKCSPKHWLPSSFSPVSPIEVPHNDSIVENWQSSR